MPSLAPILCCGPTPALQRTLAFADWDSASDVVRASSVRLSVGGKATNAARAITCAHGTATVLSFAGSNEIIDLLEKEGLPGHWIPTASPTRICQTLVDANGKRIRELVENAGPVSDAEWDALYTSVTDLLPTHSGLLLCGSLPEGTDPTRYADLIRIAHDQGKPVGIDAKGAEMKHALAHTPELVKINQQELNDLGIPLTDLEIPTALITNGPHPAQLLTDGTIHTFNLPKIDPLNPIGGGDTVTGVMFLHLLNGLSPQDATSHALAAGLAQTMTPNPAEFDSESAAKFIEQVERSF